MFFANRANDEKAKRDEAKRKEDEAKTTGQIVLGPDGKPLRVNGKLVTKPGQEGNVALQTLVTDEAKLTAEAKTLLTTYGSASVARPIATAVTGAAGANVSTGLTGLARGTAVNILQGLAVTKIKAIADSFGKRRLDGSLDRGTDGQIIKTTESETIRAALQGFVGCAGAAAGNASCTSGALGASASVALNLIVDALEKEKRVDTNSDGVADSYTLEAQQARTALIATLTGALAAALNGDPGLR